MAASLISDCDVNLIPCEHDEDCNLKCKTNKELMNYEGADNIFVYYCNSGFCDKKSIRVKYWQYALEDYKVDMKFPHFFTLDQIQFMQKEPAKFLEKRAKFYELFERRQNINKIYEDIVNHPSRLQAIKIFEQQSKTSEVKENLKISFNQYKNFVLGPRYSPGEKDSPLSDLEQTLQLKGDEHRKKYAKSLIKTILSNDETMIGVLENSKDADDITYLCNENNFGGLELVRFDLMGIPGEEIAICFCNFPNKITGPACKWETRLDVNPHLYKGDGPRILEDNLNDYNEAMDFCRNISENLVTIWDNSKRTYFCKPKTERIQETLTNNATSNVLSFMHKKYLNRKHNQPRLIYNIFEHNLLDVLFNTPTTENE